MTRHSLCRWLCTAALFTVCVTGCGAPSEPSPDKVETGASYSYNIYTECGAREAWFAGEYWEALNADPRDDNSPYGWNDPYQRGTMTRVSETAAVFEAAGNEKLYSLRPDATTYLWNCW